MKRKILSLILVFAMTVSLLTVGTGAVEPTYGDTAGHWAESSIERWSAYGIIQGSNGQFDPNGQLTCAQLATILAKLLKLPAAKDAGFTDNTADAWYYDAINRCAAAGILNGNGDGTVTPEAPITRERAMVMLARALGIEPIRKPDLTKYTDAAQVSAYAQGYVAALIEAGIVGGVTADELAPQDNINRASTVTILDRAIGTYADEAGATVKADGKGIVLVVAENVKITGAPEGTKIVVADGATGLTVNGKSVSDDQTYIVPKTEPAKPSSSSGGGYSHSHSYDTSKWVFDDTTHWHASTCGHNLKIDEAAHTYNDNENDVCIVCGQVKADVAVAKIGSKNYKTLPEAVAAAADGATITLLNNVELSAALEISAKKTITLDLNGKKLSTTTKTDDTSRHYYAIDNYGVFTLLDSSAEQTGEIRARGIENLESGKMVIESGTIVAIDTNGGAAVWNKADLTINGGVFKAEHEGTSSDIYGPGCVYSEGTVLVTGGAFESANKRTYAFVSKTGSVTITPAGGKTVNISGAHGGLGIDGGTAIINGGNYSSSEYYGLYVSNDSREANVTVNDGSFTGKNYSVWIGSDVKNPVDSTLTINGGTFNKPINEQNNAAGKLKVTGGTFSSNPSAYLAEGYITLVNGGAFTVSDTDEIPVTTATVQDYLDGKYGSINGKTLVLGQGNYDKIEFGRATAYKGSNTMYYLGDNTSTVDEIKQDIKNHPNGGAGNRVYVRNMSGVTLKAAEGAAVTINGLVAFGGQVNSTKWYSRDFVADRAMSATVDNNICYWIGQKWSKITFEGLTFTDGVNIEAYGNKDTLINNVKFTGCKFNVSDTDTNETNCIRLNVDGNVAKANNLVVENCEFTDGYTAVLTDGMPNVTVTGSTFSGLTKHAINPMMNWNGAPGYGEITVTGNTFKNMSTNAAKGTILRMGKVGADAVFTIQNNTATEGITLANSIKVESLADGITYNISGNNWGSLTASDSKLDG